MASNDYYQFPSSNSFQTFSNVIPNQIFSKYKPTQPSQNPTPYFQENNSFQQPQYTEYKPQPQYQPVTQTYQSQHNAYLTTDYIPVNETKPKQEPLNTLQYSQPQKCDPKDPNCHMDYDYGDQNYDGYMIFKI